MVPSERCLSMLSAKLDASRLVMVGVDFPTVQDLRGYKDISMSLRYTPLSSSHKRCTVRAMAQLGEKSQ